MTNQFKLWDKIYLVGDLKKKKRWFECFNFHQLMLLHVGRMPGASWTCQGDTRPDQQAPEEGQGDALQNPGHHRQSNWLPILYSHALYTLCNHRLH